MPESFAILNSTTLRNALISYRAELLQQHKKFPEVFDCQKETIYAIDTALYKIEGNIGTVMISAHTCQR
jgi:hypothetical protein